MNAETDMNVASLLMLNLAPLANGVPCQRIHNLTKSALLLLHCRLVHPINEPNQLRHSEYFNKHRVLSHLSTHLEAHLELTVACRDDKDSHIHIHLRSTRGSRRGQTSCVLKH